MPPDSNIRQKLIRDECEDPTWQECQHIDDRVGDDGGFYWLFSGAGAKPDQPHGQDIEANAVEEVNMIHDWLRKLIWYPINTIDSTMDNNI